MDRTPTHFRVYGADGHVRETGAVVNGEVTVTAPDATRIVMMDGEGDGEVTLFENSVPGPGVWAPIPPAPPKEPPPPPQIVSAAGKATAVGGTTRREAQEVGSADVGSLKDALG